jgi:hypothetical protein
MTVQPLCNECETPLIETKGQYNPNMIYQFCPKCNAGCGMYDREDLIP